MNVVAADTRTSTNAELLLPYFAPYAAYVLIANLATALPRELDYLLRIIATGALLLFFRTKYQPLRGPLPVRGSLLWGVAAGILGAGIWVALLLPFTHAQLGDAVTASAFALRLLAAVLVVPFAEELLCRGYIQGVITQWQEARRAGAARPIAEVLDRQSVQNIIPGSATALAVIVSAAAFTLGHTQQQWLAAFGYGIWMSGMWIVRRDLITPITAHAVTNLVLYLYIFLTGSWGLW